VVKDHSIHDPQRLAALAKSIDSPNNHIEKAERRSIGRYDCNAWVLPSDKLLHDHGSVFFNGVGKDIVPVSLSRRFPERKYCDNSEKDVSVFR
jgi:hypothetical protein